MKTLSKNTKHQAGFTISASQQWCSRAAAQRHRPGFARPRIRSAGFTIVELMIATLVFSTILVIVTAGVLYFSRTYYASLSRANTQNTARAITASISQAVQFTGTTIATTDDTSADYFCAGNKVYVFQTGVQYQGAAATATNPGLYVAPESSGCAVVSDYTNPLAQQLLGKGMRIANLELTNLGGQLYTISLTLAYGDDNLLTATSGAGVSCIAQTGSQFCAVSTLNTTVQRRLQDSQLSD